MIPVSSESLVPPATLAYATDLGRAYQGDSRTLLTSSDVECGSVDLIVTSPPFALARKKSYGNEAADRYVAWFLSFVPVFKRVLKDTGSLVIDIGGAYIPGIPRRSIYHFQLVVELARHFDLCQELYWYNPARLPSPVEWVNRRRVRIKDSVNPIFWFAKDAGETKADNTRVLRRYSRSMESLLKNGYQYRQRPSGHSISDRFMTRHLGAIPSNLLGFTESPEALNGEPFERLFPNLLSISNTVSNDRYLRTCKRHGIRPHPARFPLGLPAFFIEFLTEPGDLVLDPFAGSNVTGEAAEALGRRWISCDLDQEAGAAGSYVRASAFRFPNVRLMPNFDFVPNGSYCVEVKQVPGEGKNTPSDDAAD